jgi:hypothetical protein
MEQPRATGRLVRLVSSLHPTAAAETAVRPPSVAELNKDDTMPSAYEEYLFDLRGYLKLEGAVGPAHVAELNACFDAMPLETIQPGSQLATIGGVTHPQGVLP